MVVRPTEVELDVDATRRLVAEVYDPRGSRIEGARARWFAPTDIVSVDPEGRVTAVRPGEAQVIAVYEGVPGFATVRVRELPPAEVVVTAPPSVLVGATTALEVTVRTRLGDRLPDVRTTYESSDPEIAVVDATGRVLGVRPGSAVITVAAGDARTEARVSVERNTAERYDLLVAGDGGERPVRTGDVVRLRLIGTAGDGTRVEGFRPLWTLNSPGAQIEDEAGSGVFVAEKPGVHVITAVAGPAITVSRALEVEPRRPETRLIRVGQGRISTHRSGDTWVFEGADGRDYAYIGTFYHDWMKVWDVSDPTRPVLTDSLQVDARRINDVKIHPNGRLAVITREGASSRRNGIVLLDLADPAHPTILSEYTETVTGGVHNVWILGEDDLVYACHNGTSEIHIIDISDPRAPREVGRWGIDKPFKSLHDVIVQDGYAYVSYWDDGVVTLDVGAGTHGGTPTAPVFVSQFVYPIGNTHVAWRQGRYLFVGDEIYPDDWDPERLGPIEARGYVHVLDMTDIDDPVEVARYEVSEAGAHNLWAHGDRLYVGYYQAGLRVLDISGELRGDLYRQGRELGVIKTSDPEGVIPNWSMTWGAQLFKGNIFSSDMNSGLWITRLVDTELVP